MHSSTELPANWGSEMAGDWIKMRTAIANDPAVIAMAIDLDASEFEVVGMLHHIWSWADSQSQDGHIKRVTEKWIDRYVHRIGFAKAMESAGWLIIEQDGITLPNFERHNGDSAKKRAEAAERQRISRANRPSSKVTVSSQLSCDKSVTREEKSIKEEKLLSSDESEDGKQRSKIRISEIVEAYNETCGHILPKVMTVTEGRKKQIRAMGGIEINQVHPFRDFGIDFWKAYFIDALKDPHKRGENDRGWRADFDFLTKPVNAVKILEKNHAA